MNAPTDIKALLTAGQQGKELIHESAHLHVTGEADYTDDIPEQRGTVVSCQAERPDGLVSESLASRPSAESPAEKVPGALLLRGAGL